MKDVLFFWFLLMYVNVLKLLWVKFVFIYFFFSSFTSMYTSWKKYSWFMLSNFLRFDYHTPTFCHLQSIFSVVQWKPYILIYVGDRKTIWSEKSNTSIFHLSLSRLLFPLKRCEKSNYYAVLLLFLDCCHKFLLSIYYFSIVFIISIIQGSFLFFFSLFLSQRTGIILAHLFFFFLTREKCG